MSKICNACGMPLTQREDFAGGNESLDFCLHCADTAGNVRSCEEIFEGGVTFFMGSTDADRALAERVTRKNMKGLPQWQGKACVCLQGEEATDEEFKDALAKL